MQACRDARRVPQLVRLAVRHGRNPRDSAQEEVDVFLFYSNRLGCLVSLLLSAALTGLLILILYR